MDSGGGAKTKNKVGCCLCSAEQPMIARQSGARRRALPVRRIGHVLAQRKKLNKGSQNEPAAHIDGRSCNKQAMPLVCSSTQHSTTLPLLSALVIVRSLLSRAIFRHPQPRQQTSGAQRALVSVSSSLLLSAHKHTEETVARGTGSTFRGAVTKRWGIVRFFSFADIGPTWRTQPHQRTFCHFAEAPQLHPHHNTPTTITSLITATRREIREGHLFLCFCLTSLPAQTSFPPPASTTIRPLYNKTEGGLFLCMLLCVCVYAFVCVCVCVR